MRWLLRAEFGLNTLEVMDFTADLLNKSVYCAVGAMPRGFPSLALLDGRSMPAFGLGVYRSPAGSECYNAVKWALDLGALVHFPLAAVRLPLCGHRRALRQRGECGRGGPRLAAAERGALDHQQALGQRLGVLLGGRHLGDHGYEKAIRACELSAKKLGPMATRRGVRSAEV